MVSFLASVWLVVLVGWAASSDSHDKRFTNCCKTAGISCLKFCVYPPPAPSAKEAACLVPYYNQFIKCYANGKDNTKCCKAAGVHKIGTGQCTDLCNGTDPNYKPEKKYWVCQEVVKKIAKCNEDS